MFKTDVEVCLESVDPGLPGEICEAVKLDTFWGYLFCELVAMLGAPAQRAIFLYF